MNAEYLEPAVIERVAIAPVIHLSFKLRIVHVSPSSFHLASPSALCNNNNSFQFDALVRAGNVRCRVRSGDFGSPRDPGVSWSLTVSPAVLNGYGEPLTEIRLSQNGLPVNAPLVSPSHFPFLASHSRRK